MLVFVFLSVVIRVALLLYNWLTHPKYNTTQYFIINSPQEVFLSQFTMCIYNINKTNDINYNNLPVLDI